MAMELDGELHYFFASEEKGHPCYAYPHHDLKNRKVVWEQGGGTMSMIPLPNTKNQFIAIMDFYLKECPSQSKLVWFTYKDGAFIQKDLFYLPFLHRFDLYQVQDDVYFIGATIAHDKKDKEDWSLPGKIYTAKLPQDLNQSQDITFSNEINSADSFQLLQQILGNDPTTIIENFLINLLQNPDVVKKIVTDEKNV